MAEPVILTDIQNRVATLTFNRPDRLNALNGELLEAAIQTLRSWSEDPEVGCVVLTGAGRAFCAGGDITGMKSSEAPPSTVEQQIDRMKRVHEFAWLLYSMPKVTVACVNGFAFGAGLAICLCCDLRIASDQAKFGTAYSKIAFGGDFGITWLLTHYAGAPAAKQLLFFADTFDATEARRLGLLNEIVPHDSLGVETRALAHRIAGGPLVTFRYQKANVNAAASSDFRAALDREAETHVRCGQTEDHQEGVAAFLEKRAPDFRGR